MITRYQMHLSTENGAELPQNWAYRLYAWLLSQAPEEEAQETHQQDRRTISQYLDHHLWTVTFLDDQAAQCYGAILDGAHEILLSTDTVIVKDRKVETIPGAEEFLRRGKEARSRRTELCFRSPTSFKRDGRYAVYPEETLVIRSIVSKWNETFPEFLLDDADMLELLYKDVHIADYSLRTTRYRLKEASIPSFYGKIYLEARLPVVIQEIWNALLAFAPYSGIGMKTTLGMGGTTLQSPSER